MRIFIIISQPSLFPNRSYQQLGRVSDKICCWNEATGLDSFPSPWLCIRVEEGPVMSTGCLAVGSISKKVPILRIHLASA